MKKNTVPQDLDPFLVFANERKESRRLAQEQRLKRNKRDNRRRKDLDEEDMRYE